MPVFNLRAVFHPQHVFTRSSKCEREPGPLFGDAEDARQPRLGESGRRSFANHTHTSPNFFIDPNCVLPHLLQAKPTIRAWTITYRRRRAALATGKTSRWARRPGRRRSRRAPRPQSASRGRCSSVDCRPTSMRVSVNTRMVINDCVVMHQCVCMLQRKQWKLNAPVVAGLHLRC